VVKAEVERLQKDQPGLSPTQAQQQVKVNTFDMIVLARAGKGALQYLGSGGSVAAVTTAPQVESARRELAALQKKSTPEGELKPARDRLAEAQQGLQQRLESEWFFTPTFQVIMFLFLLVGFAIKVPVFPFHTWLPDAHVEAPTPISMILAGVLLKMGGYGLLRIAYPICPWAAEQLATWVALFGVINIVYGAFVAMAQTDFKKLVAYSSISHMGYVILGIAVWSTPENRAAWSLGMNGAMFQMIAHGITSAGMFFLVGVIYDRAHHRNLDNFRGLYEPMPLYGGVSAIIFFAAMGLPGMCGFIGEVMVVLSTWKFAPDGQQWVGITFAVLAAVTVVLTAAYILWTIQRVFMGQNPQYKNFPDISPSELSCALPLVVLAVLLGVLPQLFLLNWMEPSVTHLVDTLVSYRP
jgi:NADH-quinone oxidoreductase subunit M